MLKREKMFLIASNVDESIKSQTSVYDLTLFKTFVDFEKFINETPVIVSTIILSANELQFTNTNMQRLINVLKSPFLTITGSVIYLIDNSYDYVDVDKFFKSQDSVSWAVYQGDLSYKFINDIVSGEGRQATEGRIDLITYRIRSSDYIRLKNQREREYDLDDHYISDDEQLEGIPDEKEPEDIQSSSVSRGNINYIVGDNNTERTLFAFLVAQYRSITGKTLIFEKDVSYHRLTEFVTKTGIDCELIEIQDVIQDITKCVKRVRDTEKKLVVIGAVKRVSFDYNFLFDIFISNLINDVEYFVRECEFNETPYGHIYTVVVPNNIPDLLKCCNSLQYDIRPLDVTFVGMELNNIYPASINSDEMASVISSVLGKNMIGAQVVKVNGLTLSQKEDVYDVLGVLSRADRR